MALDSKPLFKTMLRKLDLSEFELDLNNISVDTVGSLAFQTSYQPGAARVVEVSRRSKHISEPLERRAQMQGVRASFLQSQGAQ